MTTLGLFDDPAATRPVALALYDYQLEAVERIRQMIRQGVRRILVVSPTGSGKTVCFSYVIARIVEKGRRALVCAHRIELIRQTRDKMIAAGIPRAQVGVMMRALERGNPYAAVQVASIDTLRARLPPELPADVAALVAGDPVVVAARARGAMPPADVVIQDEAHRSLSNTSRRVARAYPNAIHLGFSVGPDTVVELRGGPFGDGWIGPIEGAFALAQSACPQRIVDGYELVATGDAAVEARGWTGDRFAWKSVRTAIRHPCVSPTQAIRVGGDTITLTGDHAVYRVEQPNGAPHAALRSRPAEEIRVGDVLALDDGQGWEDGSRERPVDVTDFAADGTTVAVDLTHATRKAIGANARDWYNYRHTGAHGHHMPALLYRRHRATLPKPTRVYTDGANGVGVAPEVMLSDWAYVLGFWLGDGWVDGNRVNFAVELARVDDFLGRLRSMRGLDWHPKVRDMPGAAAEIRCASVIVARLLRSQFGAARAWTKSIPPSWILTWPKQARIELLHGLIDSDGCVGRTPTGSVRAHYVTTSRALARDILSLLRSVGVQGSIHTRQPCVGGTVGGRVIRGKRAAYQVHWSIFAMNGDNVGHRGARARHAHGPMKLRETVVRSTAACERPGFVYDLEMDGHPSFVANGVLVHNTATPWRMDTQSFRDLYDAILVVADVPDLIARGFLARPRVFSHPRTPDLSKVRVRSNGEYDEEQLAAVMDNAILIGDVVDHWLLHAGGARTFVFASSVAHSRHLAAEFNRRGIPAEHVDGETDPEARAAALARLKSGATRVVSNYSVFCEGTDEPLVKCIVIARPTLSLSLYMQMGGRGMRRVRAWRDVTTYVLLDHAGCARRHGLPDDAREYSLDGKPPREGGQTKECACGRTLPRNAQTCDGCGFVFGAPREPGEGRALPDSLDGDLEEVDASERKKKREARAVSTLRRRIQGLAIEADRERGWPDGWSNRMVVIQYGKGRPDMSTTELQEVLRWFESGDFAKRYPVSPFAPTAAPKPAAF